MLRTVCAFTVLFVAAGSGRSADPAPPSGNWKLTVPIDRGEETIMLVKLAEKDGKWTGEYLGASDELKVKPAVTAVTVTGDTVQFALGFMGRELLSFDGALSKDKKKLNGSLSVVGGRLQLTTMYPTKLAKLDDPFALAREALTQAEDGPEMFGAAFAVLAQAGEKKMPVDEVRGVVERLNKTAGTFGPRWERDMTLRTVDLLAAQPTLSELAVAQAKRAERLLTDEDSAATRIVVLEALVRTLTKAGKADDAKPYQTQLTKLELREFRGLRQNEPTVQSGSVRRAQGENGQNGRGRGFHRGRVPAVRRRRSRVRRPAEGVQAVRRDPAPVPLPRAASGPAHQPGRYGPRRVLLRQDSGRAHAVH